MSKNRTKIKKLEKGQRDMSKAYRRQVDESTALASAIREFLPKEQFDAFAKFYAEY